VKVSPLVILVAVPLALVVAIASAQTPKKTPAVINPAPTAQDYADLGKLPDWSGVWNPKISDQDAQVKTNPPPWNEVAAKKIEFMFAEEKAQQWRHARDRTHPPRRQGHPA
jgi:hypothetical protein